MFGREQELSELVARLSHGRPFLLHGPAGMGKTLLMKSVLARMAPGTYLYCAETKGLNAFVKMLCAQLAALGEPWVRSCLKLKHEATAAQVRPAIEARSNVGLKAIVRDSLRQQPRLIVCDHAGFISQQFYNYLRDLDLQCRASIVAIARSYHMEEIGYLSAFYADWRARLELKGFDLERAAEFAAQVAASEGLQADNAGEFIGKVVKSSLGNPSAILRMIAMARDPRYRSGNQIRLNLLCVDYCMHAAPSPGSR